ncbi:MULTISPECIES: hypothetical protein [Paraburkholderia]|uniref:hypothetical protein n=1 Tax=Paraburkholderia TaxID=1822464 RepID=UPI002111FFD3|nr:MULTISPECIES: hypothetical protein [Paraburkholderia]MCP2089430.1 ribosomal protein S18 acetylase RimI-like enzyme [Paraburkholderia sediminicola]MCX4153172.1 hypothetical protein [Paraburkholderia aspalathi]MDN7162586.1 hypothetical protein [Paraburkholderia sp. SECH2]MDQ6391072.1 hypothetical protein [Paraburkholderia aspalathi]
MAGQFAESPRCGDFLRLEPRDEAPGTQTRGLYERLGFEIVAEEEIEFLMRRAPHASAQIRAE